MFTNQRNMVYPCATFSMLLPIKVFSTHTIAGYRRCSFEIYATQIIIIYIIITMCAATPRLYTTSSELLELKSKSINLFEDTSMRLMLVSISKVSIKKVYYLAYYHSATPILLSFPYHFQFKI